MSKPIKRVYVYKDLKEEVLAFAAEHDLKLTSPNRKNNFPYYLERYLNHLKFMAGRQK